jgi:hypothetical protein
LEAKTKQWRPGSKDADPVPLIHGRFGFGVPKAKQNSVVLDEVEGSIADYCAADVSAVVNTTHLQQVAVLASSLASAADHGADDDDAVGGAAGSVDEVSASIDSITSKTFLIASIFLFCDWTVFVSCFEFGCAVE